LVYAERRSSSGDQNLKAALPLINGTKGMLGVALFIWGWPIISLAKAADEQGASAAAATYSEQAAKIKGPVAQQAWKNAQVMKTEAAKMR